MVSTVKFKQDNNRQPDSGRKKDKQKRQRRTATKAIKMACHGRLFLWKNSNGRAAQIVYNSDDSSIAAAAAEHYRERGEQLRLQMGPASTPAKPSVDGGGEEDEENEWMMMFILRKLLRYLSSPFQKDNDGRKECTFGTCTIMVQNYYNDT